jgi:hypothetical protein
MYPMRRVGVIGIAAKFDGATVFDGDQHGTSVGAIQRAGRGADLAVHGFILDAAGLGGARRGRPRLPRV